MATQKIYAPDPLSSENVTDADFTIWCHELETWLETNPNNEQFISGNYKQWTSYQKHSTQNPDSC